VHFYASTFEPKLINVVELSISIQGGNIFYFEMDSAKLNISNIYIMCVGSIARSLGCKASNTDQNHLVVAH
jgi:hypothetical protein